MRTINKIITEVSTKFGAPMGRRNIGDLQIEGKRIFDCRVPMCYTDPAYDKGGAYWGLGNQLRVSYTKDLTYVNFYRHGQN